MKKKLIWKVVSIVCLFLSAVLFIWSISHFNDATELIRQLQPHIRILSAIGPPDDIIFYTIMLSLTLSLALASYAFDDSEKKQ